MTFVVIYLIGAREIIVVPDKWVFDLNTAKLKNNGRNSNQNFLAYCSFVDGEPELAKEPNFDVPIFGEFNINMGEACFLCRVKKFFGE